MKFIADADTLRNFHDRAEPELEGDGDRLLEVFPEPEPSQAFVPNAYLPPPD